MEIDFYPMKNPQNLLRCAVSVFLGLSLFPLLSCSKVIVKKTGNQKYSLKCYYSRSKCEDKVAKLCKDEGKASNVLMRKESVGVSWFFWPIGLLTTDRPVSHLLVECVDPKPKEAAEAGIRETVADSIPSTGPVSKEQAPAFNFLNQEVSP